ncbi:MAG TPA: FHA domain-containing protein [Planctomycetota bacterium]|nr:FHA domain-containing protein [Planctomycetota bacterium]
MPAKLTFVRGKQTGTELTLDGRSVFDLGSSPGPAGFKVEGTGIAPNHMRIFREDKKFTVFDLSGKGVTLNGKRISSMAPLSDGDEIEIGGVAFKFEGADAEEAAGVGRPASEKTDAPALLYGLDGPDKGKVWPLPVGRNSFTMGRGVTADVVILDIKCSREHCRVERRGSAYVLVDLGSTNGSRLNGKKVAAKSTTPLKWGDQIGIGKSLVELRTQASAPTAKLDKQRPTAPLPPPQAAPPPQPAPPPPPPKAPVAQPAADVTFDFGEPPPVTLPSRAAATDHLDDDAGQEALRTFVFEEQPKDFAPVDQSGETDPELKRKAKLKPIAEPPLDDYGTAPVPPAPEEPKPGKKSHRKIDKASDAAVRTFVFDDPASFDEAGEPETQDDSEPEPEPEPKPDVALRTFVFDETPQFDEPKVEPKAEKKAPVPPPKKDVAPPKQDVAPPRKKEPTDAAIRTFVFDETPTFEEPPKREATDPAIRTFVFDEAPTFDEPKPEAKKKDAPPPKKEATDAAIRTFVFDEEPSFEEPKPAPPRKEASPPKKKDPTDAAIRTFVFDETPAFDQEPKAEPPADDFDFKAMAVDVPDLAPPPPPPPPPPPSMVKKAPVTPRPADDEDEERPPEFSTQIIDGDVKPKKGGDEDEEPPESFRTFVFDEPPQF